MRKVFVLIMILVGLTLAINQVQAEPPIVIGYNDILSGPFKSNGEFYLMGIEEAVKEINEAGGLLGRPIKIVKEDNQMKPEIAIQKLKKMILKDKCEVIFGGGTSASCIAIGQAIPRYKKLFLPSGVALDITGKHFNRYVFRPTFNVLINIKALAFYMGKQKQFKKVYMINQDYSYGHDAATLYERFIKEFSPDTEIVGKDFHPMFNKDFAPYISKIKASGADYVFTGNWGMDLSQLIIQGRSLGMDLLMTGPLMGDHNNVKAMPGDQAVGSIGAGMFPPGIDTPKARKFEDSFYKATGGTWPVGQIYIGYQMMMMYAEAVKKAGSLDVEKMIKAFEGLKWEGPAGTVTMRAKDHQAIQPIFIEQVVKKTRYFDFPYTKPIEVVPAEQISYKPEDFGWKPYKGK
jgi:branched-chain amino acid transport system substrate-binding protein